MGKSRAEIEREAVEALKGLKRLSGGSVTRLLRSLNQALKYSIESRHRVMVVVSGSDPAKLGLLTARILLYYEKVYKRVSGGGRSLRVLYVFHDEFDDARLRKEIVKRAIKSKAELLSHSTARYEESERYLGTTFQALVLDLSNDLKPNDVGRLVGIVEGGGIIVLQTPPWDEWDSKLTLFKESLLVPGYDEPRHIFIGWFKEKLLKHSRNIFVYDADRDEILGGEPFKAPPRESRRIEIPEKRIFPVDVYRLALTQDQVEVVKSMEWLFEKPQKGSRKVIVVTADRGRGKSCAVGLGLVGLAKELGKVKHRVRIIVTAPSLSNVQSLMELALRAAEKAGLRPRPIKREGMIMEIQGEKFSIEYWEPYQVTRLQADIVAVDEASGIHVPLLHRIWRSHRRLVFAATIHGYEGAGRGFSVRFLSTIKKDSNTQLRTLEMREPIRYSLDDPIEAWLFDVLLLDAEPARLDKVDLEDIEAKNLEYLKLDPKWLFSREGEETLRQLFGIYVLAHYRNEPDDLGMLADAPHHSIRVARTRRGKKIVSAAQVAEEGGLDDAMIERLLKGEKIPGNIIPDRLLKHSRIREFGRMKGWRIVRIATHPEVQGRGVGSWLLSRLYEESIERGYDWLGSGFGVNEKLLKFWLANGFFAVHLSPDRNPVSGEYTTLVIKPIEDVCREAVSTALREFKLKLLHSLYDTYSDLETEIAIMLLSQDGGILQGYKPDFTRIQVDRLWIYVYGPMTYEAANDLIYELARAYWIQEPGERPSLSQFEERILVARVLQAKGWDEVAEELSTRPYFVMSRLKEAVKKMARHYFGLDESSEIGVSIGG